MDVTVGEAFEVTPQTPVVFQSGVPHLERIAHYLAQLIGATPVTPLPVSAALGPPPDGSIYLALAADPRGSAEGYELTVSPRRIDIVAREPAGVFYGVQTLRGLLPVAVEYVAARPRPRPFSVPAVRIVDAPRFEWRGAMLDVSRHFFGMAAVQRYIDLLAMLKINRLHLHLADDQGWRIEITRWPNLARHGGSTEVGGGPGGFYTQEDYTAIVRYAQERFITIVPEIDMPGHTNAALASYAELNCDNVAPPLYTGIEVGFSALCVEKEVTYQFIDDVVREIAALTPGPYFHIGGDEVKTLTAEQYRSFIERVQGIVESHGKQMIGWDEIAPVNLLPTSIVQHWRPKSTPREAMDRNIKLIMSPAHRAYLDMKYHKETPIGLDWAGVIEVRDAYDWDPASLVEGVTEQSILGVEGPLWSETLGTMSDVEYLAFPRIAALAETAWSPQKHRRWDDFRVRLGTQAMRWVALGVNFYRSPDVPWRH
jgi:hexosaminidase